MLSTTSKGAHRALVARSFRVRRLGARPPLSAQTGARIQRLPGAIEAVLEGRMHRAPDRSAESGSAEMGSGHRRPFGKAAAPRSTTWFRPGRLHRPSWCSSPAGRSATTTFAFWRTGSGTRPISRGPRCTSCPGPGSAGERRLPPGSRQTRRLKGSGTIQLQADDRSHDCLSGMEIGPGNHLGGRKAELSWGDLKSRASQPPGAVPPRSSRR